MTDIAVVGPAALRQPTKQSLPTSAISQTTDIVDHDKTALPSITFDDHSSQGSTESQRSRPATLKLATDHVSQPDFPSITTEDITPPSSTHSPVEHTLNSNSPSPSKERSQFALHSITQDRPKPHNGSQSPSQTGTKRTASGEIKQSDINETSTSSGDKTSVQSIAEKASAPTGNVQEISQQLRTKLKYAMLKVQNGWQSRTLDEVESLASASPRSVVSGFHNNHDTSLISSPRNVISAKMRKWSQSDGSQSPVSEIQILAGSTSQQPPPMRNHPNSSSRGLAPPANIVSGTRRRPMYNGNPAHSGPFGLHGQTRAAHIVRPSVNQRTPSQNAAMEADAVETLLFMASPSNSGYHPSQESSLRSTQHPASQTTSPLRAQFNQATLISPKKVAFTENPIGFDVIQKAALIDQMLDEMSDEHDSELEEALRLADKSSSVKHQSDQPAVPAVNANR